MAKSKASWQHSDLPKHIRILLYRIMKDNSNQRAREQAVAKLKLNLSEEDQYWSLSSRDTFRKLTLELLEMPKEELDTLDKDVQVHVLDLRKQQENKSPQSSKKQTPSKPENETSIKPIIQPEILADKLYFSKPDSNLVISRSQLLPDVVWRPYLVGDIDLLTWIRHELQKRVPGIIEKFNRGSLYFGYKTGKSDKLNIFIKYDYLDIWAKINREEATSELKRLGFTISPEKCWQFRAGWLTGWRIPLDFDIRKGEYIIPYMVKALANFGPL